MSHPSHGPASSAGHGGFLDAESEERWYPEEVAAEQPLINAGSGPADTNDDRNTEAKSEAGESDREVAGWMDLPKKKQLLVIVLARLSEPLAQTSLQAYMYYQLKWFDPSLPDAVISRQAGALQASFTFAQCLTAMVWGRLADSSRFGRKFVILCGLFGTLVSCIGYGFSTTFWQAMCFRVLGGITNGNVGVLRTMISETVVEKKYQPTAFLLLPMTFNIGVITGPMIGGLLSDPAGSYPQTFGGVDFFVKFPYAAPNLLSALIIFCGLISTWLCLEETLDSRLGKRDFGIQLGHKLSRLLTSGCLSRGEKSGSYSPLASNDASRDASIDFEMTPPSSTRSSLEEPAEERNPPARRTARYSQRLPFRRIFTRNVNLTLIAHFFLAFHIGTFNSLWFIFLSTPVYDPSNPSTTPNALQRHLPFFFTGGIGLPSRSVGMAMAILGFIGILLQVMLYPRLSERLGTVKSWRIFLHAFPLAYFAVPFLSIVPSTTEPPHAKTGFLIWLAIASVLLCQVAGRTFSLPAQTILVNNCSPHPSVLGTVHGIGQSTSSFARTIGPLLGGYLYGLGLEKGVVGAVWWGLSCVAIGGLFASFWVREGNGHEISLEDDDGE